MRIGYLYLIPAFVLAALAFSPPASAQSSTNNASVPYPQNITCQKIENYGVVTDKSTEHPRDIIMNFNALSDGQYSYSGIAPNWKGGGGGETANAIYDATSIRLRSLPLAPNGVKLG